VHRPEGSGEDELTAWIRRKLRHRGHYRIGDDAALLPPGPGWAVTTDQQIAGVHFPPELPPRAVARRLLAVNVSDLAAMGAKPEYALLTLSSPKSFEVKEFFRGMIRACEGFRLELVGGDLARTPKLSATMTLFGRRERGSRWLLRSNARVGDALFVGGVLGRAVAGLRLVQLGAKLEGNAIRLPEALSGQPASVIAEARRAVRAYLLPRPQVALGLWLARLPRAAAIDISDGLSLDLARLCRESGVGAEISLEALLPATTPLAHLHRALDIDSGSAILTGGDEYRLLFSVPAELRLPEELGCAQIGTISEGPELRLIESGRSRPLQPEGYDHFITDRSTDR